MVWGGTQQVLRKYFNPIQDSWASNVWQNQTAPSCSHCVFSGAKAVWKLFEIYQLDTQLVQTTYMRELTASTTALVVMPKSSYNAGPGPEAPNVSIPIVLPLDPTHCNQPNVDPASIDTRASTSGGRMLSLYSCKIYSFSFTLSGDIMTWKTTIWCLHYVDLIKYIHGKVFVLISDTRW